MEQITTSHDRRSDDEVILNIIRLLEQNRKRMDEAMERYEFYFKNRTTHTSQ